MAPPQSSTTKEQTGVRMTLDDVKVKTVLTKGSNFDEDGMQVRRYHLSEQRLLVSAPQIGQGLQAKP